MTRIERLQVRTPQGVAGDLHHASRYAFNYTATQTAAEVLLHRLRQAWGLGGDTLRPRLYPSPAPGPRGH